jgi:hypothetical protein
MPFAIMVFLSVTLGVPLNTVWGIGVTGLSCLAGYLVKAQANYENNEENT